MLGFTENRFLETASDKVDQHRWTNSRCVHLVQNWHLVLIMNLEESESVEECSITLVLCLA